MHKELKILIFIAVIFLLFSPAITNAVWFNSNYSYCKKITTTAGTGGFATTTTNGYVTLATTTLSATTANGGKVAKLDANNKLPLDVIYTNGTDCNSDGGTLLDFHHESYNQTTGDIVSWIELTDVSSTTAKSFLVYYGNASATDQSNEAGTYNSTYAGVWHLSEDPSISTDGSCGGGTKEVCDSTSNSNDGDSAGAMTTSDQVAGEVDGSLDFDGGDDYVDVVDTVSLRPVSFITVSAWVNFNNISALSGWQGITRKERGTGDESYGLDVANNQLRFIVRDASTFDVAQPALSWNINKWYYVVGIYASGDSLRLYRDGVKVGSDTSLVVSSVTYDTQQLTIGWQKAANKFINGLIDEVRIYNTALHAMDILTDYNMSTNNSAFLTWGAEETPTPAVPQSPSSTHIRSGISPTLSNIQADDITDNSAVIKWNTDTPAHGEVYYGLDFSPTNLKVDWTQTKEHSILLTDLQPETIYYYSIRSRDSASNSELAISIRFSFTTKKEADKTAPDSPKFLRARSSSSDIIDLAWSAVNDKDIVKYNVYRDNALISTAFNNNYRDNNLSPNTSYTYAISAIDESLNESGKATVTQETTRSINAYRTRGEDVTPPSTPKNLKVKAMSDSRIDLSWEKSEDKDNIIVYKVFRDGVLVDTKTSTFYKDVDLSPNTAYSYSISAFDTSMNESSSAFPVKATTLTEAEYIEKRKNKNIISKLIQKANEVAMATVLMFWRK